MRFLEGFGIMTILIVCRSVVVSLSLEPMLMVFRYQWQRVEVLKGEEVTTRVLGSFVT